MTRASEPRLLLVRLGAVGDVVRTLPLLRALQAGQPDGSIAWAVEEPSAALLAAIVQPPRVHVLPRRAIARDLRRPWRWGAAARALREVASGLRSERFDLVLDAHGTLKSAVVSRLAGGVRTEGFAPGGSKECASRLYSRAHALPATPMTRVERALYLGHAAGLLSQGAPTGAHDDSRTDFGLRFAPSEGRAAEAFLAQHGGPERGPVVTLFPFASAAGQAKRWPIERHVRLASALAERGARVVLAWGSPREGDEARAALAAHAPGRPGVRLAPPTTLPQLAEMLRRSDLLVTGDTGPMHLAAGVGTRVLALFGASDPVANRPWGPGHEVLAARDLARLEVAEVASAASRMLGFDRGGR